MNPVNVSLFSAIGVMLETNRITDSIQELFRTFNPIDRENQGSTCSRCSDSRVGASEKILKLSAIILKVKELLLIGVARADDF
jgi:hypothetical protein